MDIVVKGIHIGHEYNYAYGNVTVLSYDMEKDKFFCYYDESRIGIQIIKEEIKTHEHKPTKIYIVVKSGFIYPVGSIFLKNFEESFYFDYELEKWIGKYKEYCVEITNENIQYVNYLRSYINENYKYLPYCEITDVHFTVNGFHDVNKIKGILMYYENGTIMLNSGLFMHKGTVRINLRLTRFFREFRSLPTRCYIISCDNSYCKTIRKFISPEIE